MAALTGSYDAQRKDGELARYPLAAGARVWKGGLVGIGPGGLVAAASDAAGEVAAGVAYESADNSNGIAGAITLRVQKVGSYVYGKSGAVQGDVGKTAFVVDDNTVSTAATGNNVACGVVIGLVDTGHLRVRIDGRVS